MSFKFDACGIVCVIITYLSVIYSDYVIVYWILPDTTGLWGPINVILFNSCIFLLIVSHLKAVLTDPGIVPIARLDFSNPTQHAEWKIISENDWTFCNRCSSYRPPHAHHCRICKRCIRYTNI